MAEKNKKLALVLSGGGFKGAFQIGALEYLMYNPIQIDGEVLDIDHFHLISGVSVGSLNGAFIATGQLEKLKEIWFDKIINEGPDIVYTSKYLVNGQPDIKKNHFRSGPPFIHLGTSMVDIFPSKTGKTGPNGSQQFFESGGIG